MFFFHFPKSHFAWYGLTEVKKWKNAYDDEALRAGCLSLCRRCNPMTIAEHYQIPCPRWGGFSVHTMTRWMRIISANELASYANRHKNDYSPEHNFSAMDLIGGLGRGSISASWWDGNVHEILRKTACVVVLRVRMIHWRGGNTYLITLVNPVHYLKLAFGLADIDQRHHCSDFACY